jgi:hypothetical protein
MKRSILVVAALLGTLFISTSTQAQGPQSSRPGVPRLVKFVGQVSRPVHRAVAEGATEPPRLSANGSDAGSSLGEGGSGQTGRSVQQASMTFAIYAEQEGGAALWQETQNVALDGEGRYSVLLGAASRDGMPAELFTGGEARWLGVRVGVPGDEEASQEQARVLLVSVPYALRAADAETLGGRAATDFVLREELAGWAGVGQGGGHGSGAGGFGVGQTWRSVLQDGPRATGGGQAVAVDATAMTVSRVPRVQAATGSLITFTNGQFFDNGTGVGLGTTSPVALLDLQLATTVPRDTLSSAVTLNNSADITGSGVVTPFRMTLNDQSTGPVLSKQAMRVIYDRNVGASGGVSAFDSAITLATFMRESAPYTYRALNVEGPRIFNGKTLDTLFGIFIEAPPATVAGQPAGTITNKFALVTAPGSGNVGIGTTAPGNLLEVAGGNIKLATPGMAIVFPDNTVLTSATAGTNGGTITSVTAGAGLTGGGTVGGVTLSASFGGTGAATALARSDHNHNATYLPLTGGTLTGGLTGTSANFSSDLTLGGAINGGFRVLSTAGAANIVGGSSGNSITAGVVGAVIGGGGGPGICLNFSNQVTDDFGSVGGGCGNWAGDGFGSTTDKAYATVAGGFANVASALRSTVGGGNSNTASGSSATVGGGAGNTASGFAATVSGGWSNTVGGGVATVSGGYGNVASGDYATIGGGYGNTASALKATIAGGGQTDDLNAATRNRVTDDFGTVGGGGNNQAGDAAGTNDDSTFATVGGGRGNIARGSSATIAGGRSNIASLESTVGGGVTNSANGTASTIAGGANNSVSNFFSTVGGGAINAASSHGATVGGGSSNTASGNSSTVPGGINNTAAGNYGFAAGRRAKANHDGAFVWADSTDADFASTANNQFLIRATGGVGINTNTTGADLTFPNTVKDNKIHLFDGVGDKYGFGVAAGQLRVFPGAGGAVVFGNYDGATFNEKMRIVAPAGTAAASVGINQSSPADTLHVGGEARVNSCVKNSGGGSIAGTCSSDLRLKKHIRAFRPLLGQFAQLQPVYFEWRTAEFPDFHFGPQTNTGLIAQDVEKLFPSLVSTDDRGYKRVNYTDLQMVMVQALKDLAAQNKAQQDENQRLGRELEELRATVAALAAQVQAGRPGPLRPRR